MTGPITTTGTLTDGRTIVLDQALGTKPGPVRLTVEPLDRAPVQKPFREFLAELHKRRAVREHVPRTREEIDRALQEERDSWGD